MSPRAAWRLEALGFEDVNDYVAGKADWLANGLPREGRAATVPYAGDLVDADPPTCRPGDTVARLRERLGGGGDAFLLVLNERRIVLGRVRRGALLRAEPSAGAVDVMEPGPSTVRPNVPARDLVRRLTDRGLGSAIVTTPAGRLVGVFRRRDAEERLGGIERSGPPHR
ncbi:MAG: CBS domain-containing protein [Actinomycetota bacterium]